MVFLNLNLVTQPTLTTVLQNLLPILLPLNIHSGVMQWMRSFKHPKSKAHGL